MQCTLTGLVLTPMQQSLLIWKSLTTSLITSNVSVGAQNLFDQKAERIEGSAGAVAEGVPGNVLGAIFYETSPMGIEGAYWYVKAGYNF